MVPNFNKFNGYSIFDDKGEVKRLVESLILKNDPEVRIESMRKFEFSYIFTLSKRGKIEEVELTRNEIDQSWNWRNENIDSTLKKKIETAISNL